ncbi:MAG: hypothetical protein IJC84_06735 [Clostridia bacterium]|nr:hypothetical protein [Clostridia bacterium]
MFKIGDVICYSLHGICRLDDVREMAHTGEPQEYYVLTPLAKAGSTLYVPCAREDLKERMRYPMTRPAMEALLSAAPAMETVWERDFRRRSEWSKAALLSGEGERLLRLIKTIYDHKKENVAVGKRLHTTDDYFLKDAEALLFFEMSYVLGISVEEARPRVRTLLEFAGE